MNAFDFRGSSTLPLGLHLGGIGGYFKAALSKNGHMITIKAISRFN